MKKMLFHNRSIAYTSQYKKLGVHLNPKVVGTAEALAILNLNH